MVCFECQKCNETVRKPKLEKHLLFCGSHYVSCIDCSKVFRWDEWQEHTSCMSEAQKYQGNLYQAKESTNKGARKQDAWTESVERCVEDPGSDISPNLRNYLRKLMGFSNIPRKQKPFANFVKNSLNIWDDKKIQEIWDVISSVTSKANSNTLKANGNVREANGTAARANGAAVEAARANGGTQQQERWGGWKRVLDEELTASGGQLPWKRLCDVVVERCFKCGGAQSASNEELRYQALAAIPASYLSKEDELVRLPSR